VVPGPPRDSGLVVFVWTRLGKFLHDQTTHTPALLKAALAHVQFETIQPFLDGDGNGRVGRLLITLLLCVEGILREPMLYLSLYLKQNRPRYYDLLERVRSEGEWEEWVEFFGEGIAETSENAVGAARKLQEMAEDDRGRIRDVGRRAGSAAAVHHALQRTPISTIPRLARKTRLSLPTIAKALGVLGELGIIREVTGKQRRRIYRYDRYLEILNQGTEPIRP
jgi:cell filamentation protein, protein adenylyltransferase